MVMSQNITPSSRLEMTGQNSKSQDYLIALTKFVSELFGIPEEILRGPSRKQDYVIPRMWIMARAKQDTKLTLKSIAIFFNRDHSTVIHAVQLYDFEMSSSGTNDYKKGFARANFEWALLNEVV